ncbi:hypothetical protein ACMBCM_06050, partial [Spiroplasma sp. K1]
MVHCKENKKLGVQVQDFIIIIIIIIIIFNFFILFLFCFVWNKTLFFEKQVHVYVEPVSLILFLIDQR